jgi:hypothetical protein
MRNNKFTPIDKCVICLCKLTEKNTNYKQDICDDCHHQQSKKEQLSDDLDIDDDWLGI